MEKWNEMVSKVSTGQASDHAIGSPGNEACSRRIGWSQTDQPWTHHSEQTFRQLCVHTGPRCNSCESFFSAKIVIAVAIARFGKHTSTRPREQKTDGLCFLQSRERFSGKSRAALIHLWLPGGISRIRHWNCNIKYGYRSKHVFIKIHILNM